MIQSSIETRTKHPSKNINSKKFSFAQSFKPLYCFIRMFGFMPFSIVHDSNGGIQTARVTMVDFLWFIISNGVYMMSAFHNVTLFIRRSSIVGIPVLLANCTTSIVILRKLFDCLSIALDMCNRFKIVGILKKINTFDEKVSN